MQAAQTAPPDQTEAIETTAQHLRDWIISMNFDGPPNADDRLCPAPVITVTSVLGVSKQHLYAQLRGREPIQPNTRQKMDDLSVMKRIKDAGALRSADWKYIERRLAGLPARA